MPGKVHSIYQAINKCSLHPLNTRLMFLCLDKYHICPGAQFQSYLLEEFSLKPPFSVIIYHSAVFILMALPPTWVHRLPLLLIYSDADVLFGQLDWPF